MSIYVQYYNDVLHRDNQHIRNVHHFRLLTPVPDLLYLNMAVATGTRTPWW